jgi:salicylate hydroxylase
MTGRPPMGARPADRRALILGAGVAGLATAIALRRRGWAVEVVEQAEALREVGAGLQIAPNGARVLAALGVAVPGTASQAIHLIDGRTGRSVIRMPLGPGFALTHRADLLAALARAAERAGAVLRLGAQVGEVVAGGAVLAGGTRLSAPLVVGADGWNGPSRGFVAPGAEGRFTGQVAWRALVPLWREWPGEAQIWAGPGRHLVLYPLRGGTRLNIVAVEERAEWTAAGWSGRDDPDRLRAAFADFGDPVGEVLARVREVSLWGLHRHGMAPALAREGVVLVGDAAHPTLPFLAQGANLALEDAWVLAQALEDGGVAAYEARRRRRVTRALAEAAANARNYHLGGWRKRAAHGALRALGAVAPGTLLRRYDWLYAEDVTAAR